jgi:methyl-accepting chemotaxis protein
LENIEISGAKNDLWAEKIAVICGDVTVGCSDVNAIVARVINSSDELVIRQQQMMEAISALEGNQNSVIIACDAARNLSLEARGRLENSSGHIRAASSDVMDIVKLFQNLNYFVDNFASSIEDIKKITKNIDTLARTTNMLSLNAAIEAEKAGEAGATFGVVAQEIKALAKDTKAANDSIGLTIQNISRDADNIVSQLQAGIVKSEGMDHKFSVVDDLLQSLQSAVDDVSSQNENAATIGGDLQNLMQASQSATAYLSQGVRDNNIALKSAQSRTNAVEQLCNQMFDITVKNGFSPQDDHFVAMARKFHNQIQNFTENAVRAGELSYQDLFDRNYMLVPGSNPELYRTRLSDWADKNWRPQFDRFVAEHSQIQCTLCTDVNGFMPTHLTKTSKSSTDDPIYNAANCRNGRILLSGCDIPAKLSTAPYTMAVYCVEDGSDTNTLVRNVYMPIYWNNQRWGDLELAYKI